MKIKSILSTLAILLSVSFAMSQVNMGDVGFDEANPVDCATFGSGGPNFQDDGAAGNYSADFNDTIVFCPDLNTGTKMTLIFGVSGGVTFDVDASDSIYVYDGPDTDAPLLGVLNSDTDPTGQTYQASWDNPSGCLTVVFISDAVDEGSAGWLASVQCGNQNQPFEPHIEGFINGVGDNALNPLDSGFVDVCFGDSILFVAKPLFPYSMESTGFGYSQNVDVVGYDWNISDGGTYANNDSIWFTPPTRSGFVIDLKITDAFPQIERLVCKVRVSQQPFFTGTGPVEDTICLNAETQLLGGVTPTDTVGVDIPQGSFELGGSFAGLTYLPDGDGDQYDAPIEISGFPIGSTITNSQDLNQVCITMEHSYLGDLEIALECPNGTQVTLMNSFGAGFIPGGTSGGGTYMGDPIDDFGGGGPGEGWEYCFSSVFNTWGDYPTEFGAGNTIPAPNFGNDGASMNPNGVYLPETDFAAFAGCPINGEWTIIVQDNIGNDDGYIFEWGLFFDPSFFGDLGSYQNTVVHDFWSPNDAILSQVDTITGQTDTLLTVRPEQPGDYLFTYNVVDDFGCHYDTTVSMYVIDAPKIFNDTFVCNYNFQVTGTESFEGGVWSVDTSVILLNNSLLENPSAFADTGGVYYFVYTDNRCGFKDSSTVNFIVSPYGYIVGDTEFCEGSELTLAAFHPDGYADEYLWSTGSTDQDLVVTLPGQYWVQYINECGAATDTIDVTTKICDIQPPNVITPNGDGLNDVWFVTSAGMKEFYCEIRNRWGNVVYTYTDISGGWDGKSKSGQTVAPGVYFYYIQALSEGDQEIVQQGAITVKQ